MNAQKIIGRGNQGYVSRLSDGSGVRKTYYGGSHEQAAKKAAKQYELLTTLKETNLFPQPIRHDEGANSFIMEDLSGYSTLDDIIRSYTPYLPWVTKHKMPYDQFMNEVRVRLSDAIRQIHNEGRVHGDLHAKNVMVKLNDDGGIDDFKIIDIGSMSTIQQLSEKRYKEVKNLDENLILNYALPIPLTGRFLFYALMMTAIFGLIMTLVDTTRPRWLTLTWSVFLYFLSIYVLPNSDQMLLWSLFILYYTTVDMDRGSNWRLKLFLSYLVIMSMLHVWRSISIMKDNVNDSGRVILFVMALTAQIVLMVFAVCCSIPQFRKWISNLTILFKILGGILLLASIILASCLNFFVFINLHAGYILNVNLLLFCMTLCFVLPIAYWSLSWSCPWARPRTRYGKWIAFCIAFILPVIVSTIVYRHVAFM